jgi:antirestriction protein ArdC
MDTTATPAFGDLLRKAVTQPGLISSAYSQFHNYSFGNVLLAAVQCAGRRIPLGPMATFNRWKELGRYVRKGEKALTLCQPVTIAKKDENGEEGEVLIRFTFRNRWFVLAQTEGAEVASPTLPTWDKAEALGTLNITEIPFDLIDGNVLGFARGREVAVSPVNPHPWKTTFHEIAHVVLGHTAQADQSDSDDVPRNLAEFEAESVALLCIEALGLPGAEFARGYIQKWLGTGNAIPERSAQRILRVADQVLRAGRPVDETEGSGL